MMVQHWQDILDMSTTTRVREVLEGVKSSSDSKVSKLIKMYSQIFADYMDRWPKYRARTKYFDVRDYNTILHLRAWPIGVAALGVPLVAIYNDVSRPPTYTTALTLQEDYDVYIEEEEQGKVEFSTALLAGYKSLKVVWTGGMATKTEVVGSDGDTTVGLTLTSAESTFITDLVEPGMTVTITTAGSECTRNILSVDSENQITVDAAWVVAAAAQSFVINEAGFVGAYPDIEQALIDQIVFHWMRRKNPEVKGMALNVGMQVSFFEPLQLQTNVKNVLDNYSLVVYP